MAEYIDSNTLSKLRAISILEVADELGMGLRYHNALCISLMIPIRVCISGLPPTLVIALHAGGVEIISTW